MTNHVRDWKCNVTLPNGVLQISIDTARENLGYKELRLSQEEAI